MTDDSDSTGDEADFESELQAARSLLDDEDVTAFHVGVVRDGEEVETTFSFEAQDENVGIQSLTLLATHLRVVANEAGVDLSTAASDAVQLANQVTEMRGRLAPDEE
jgi:hypothetical protein